MHGGRLEKRMVVRRLLGEHSDEHDFEGNPKKARCEPGSLEGIDGKNMYTRGLIILAMIAIVVRYPSSSGGI